MSRVLVAEDEPLIGRLIELNLRHAGHDVSWVQDGHAALTAARDQPWDLFVLDIMLPGLTGLEIARQLREEGRTLPVLMLTARGDTASKVSGLDAGADDYLVKPFDLEELLARVRALVRRSQGSRHVPSTELVPLGRFWVHLATRQAETQQGPLVLTDKECGLMALFWRRRSETLTRAEILEEVWGMDAFPTERTVDNVVVRLRRLFEPDPDHPTLIVSVRGQGYRLQPPDPLS